MKALIIKSNHGNHQGFNRKWSIIERFENFEVFPSPSMVLAEMYNELNSFLEGDEGWKFSLDCFEEDLCYYYVVTQQSYDNGFFEGKNNGYPSQEIIDFFEE